MISRTIVLGHLATYCTIQDTVKQILKIKTLSNVFYFFQKTYLF